MSVPEGVIVYDNRDGKMPSNSKDLMEKLNAGDKSVRFVPKGFRTGSMPISEFLKHPYTIAQVGEDMLETAKRVAEYFHKKDAYVFDLDSAKSDTRRFSALYSIWTDDRLDLLGDCRGGDRGGYASGISGKSAEGGKKISEGNSLDSRIQTALSNGEAFEFNGIIYAPLKDKRLTLNQ